MDGARLINGNWYGGPNVAEIDEFRDDSVETHEDWDDPEDEDDID